MSNDLVDPGELDAFPGAPFSEEVVDAAVGNLRGYARWHIAGERTETLTLDCDGGNRVVLPSLHVTEITEVRDLCGDDPVEITNYRWSKAGILSRWCHWPRGFQSLEVDLTHGYEECPPELLPVIATACGCVDVNPNIKSRGIGPFSEGYAGMTSTQVFSSDAAVNRYALPSRP